MYSNFFLIICGPTGTGKTDLSYELAKEHPIEIINCDIGQFYEPLTIGTAKPPWKYHETKHHLFDGIVDPENFSVTSYRERVQVLLQEIWARNALPVIVGGSMFYVKALFFPPIHNQIKKLPETLAVTSKNFLALTSKELTSKELWKKLYTIDPERALNIHENDTYRIERALHLWHNSGGILPSSCKPIFNPLTVRFHITFVTREREELYQRINDRVRIMMHEGWIEEVAALSLQWQSFLIQKKVLGYPEIIAYLHETQTCCKEKDPKDKELLIQNIQKKTRNYAKRQITFWQSLQRDILQNAPNQFASELNLTLSSIDLYLKSIRDIIKENHE